MEADYYFRMGKTHTVCQDYATAGMSEGKPYALLSDGCSGSPVKGDPGSPHTDFGARFLVRSAHRNLPDLFEGHFPADRIITEAAGMARQVGLSRMALDATLLGAIYNGRFAHTFQTGDGLVAVRYRDGRIRYYLTEFGGNMPYYLGYTLDEAREREMIATARTVNTTVNTLVPGKGWGEAVVKQADIVDFPLCQTHIYEAEEVDVVLLMSDGAASFMKKGTTTAVPLESVLEQVCALKSLQGEFVTRRLTAFLDRFCPQEGWVHNDDFSVAAIHLDQPT